MEKELQNKLIKEFPELFEGLVYGFECGNGWYNLIRELCLEINKHDLNKGVRVDTVKEKLGGLRFYIGTGTSEIHDLIEEAEGKSYKICEVCGKPGRLMDIGCMSTWLRTLCDDCRRNRV